MTRATKLWAIVFTGLITAAAGLSVVPSGAAEARTRGAAAAPQEEVRIQPSHLLHHSGAELYQELCASCHGVDGEGNGPATRALGVSVPALDGLRRAGVPKRHWRYVVESPCEDSHHVSPSGKETMPCWMRHFRHALGNDAAALMVSAKLIDHLDSIQR